MQAREQLNVISLPDRAEELLEVGHGDYEQAIRKSHPLSEHDYDGHFPGGRSSGAGLL